MTNVSWYVDRLRLMSVAEVGWRIRQIVREKCTPAISRRRSIDLKPSGGWDSAFEGFVVAAHRPVFLDQQEAKQLASQQPSLVARLVPWARDLAGRNFSFFGYPTAHLPDPISWSYDPIARVHWPDLPTSRINYRSAAGDVKWIWELNRLQHLPVLAQAWQMTGEETFSGAAFRQLDSWLAQNPPGRGIAWRGAFEAGVRAISVSIAMQALRHAPGMTIDRYRLVLGMLAESARRCWADRSRFSSANNHLVGEMAGLATVAILFPELPEATRWERLAVDTLESEADRQILPDGAGAEQAVGYQVFTAELLLTVAHLLWLRDGRAPDKLMTAVVRSARYLAVLVGRNDPEPRYGDNDEGFALRLGPEPVRTVREHLAIVGAAVGDAELSQRGVDSLTAHWFCQDRSPTATHLPDDLFAVHGGLIVMRSGTRRLTMDVGPLGYLGIAAHGHADALALTLSCDGVDLVTDPGSGSYYGDPERRRAHRGTRVHATVVVDGADQSVMGGPFMWTRHASVTTHRVDLAAGVVVAEHDGYCRPGRPVIHRRWLIAPPEDGSILVVDLITGSGIHSASVSWPLAPTLRSSLADGFFAARSVDGEFGLQVRYAASVAVRADQIVGDDEGRLGWWSSRLEHPDPAPLLGIHASGRLPLAIATLLTPGDPDPAATALSVALEADRIRARWHTAGLEREVELLFDPASDQKLRIRQSGVSTAKASIERDE